MPLVIGYEEVGFRNLIAEIEPRTESALLHVKNCRNFFIVYSCCSIQGISALIACRCNQLQRTHCIATLQMGGHKIRLYGVVVCRTGICSHVDPVSRYFFQYLIDMLIVKLAGIHIDHRILSYTMEIQTNTDDLIITACADLQILQVNLAIVPAITYRCQLEIHAVTGGPFFVHNIQGDTSLHILKLEVGTELTAGHIRQIGNFFIHFRCQADKAIGHSLVVIEECLQRTARVLTLDHIIVILGVNALPACIHSHVLPTLFQGLVGLNILIIDLGIHRAVHHIKIVYIKIIGIAVGGAVIFIANLDVKGTLVILAGCNGAGNAQLPQGEEDLCPLTGLCHLTVGTIHGTPIQFHTQACIGQTQLEFYSLFHGIVDPEGQNRIFPDLICKMLLHLCLIQGNEGVAPLVSIHTSEIHLQRGLGIFTLDISRIHIDALGNTGVCQSIRTAGMQNLIQRICTNQSGNHHYPAGGLLTTTCGNGYHILSNLLRGKAQVIDLQLNLFGSILVGLLITSIFYITGFCRILDAILQLHNLTKVENFVQIGAGDQFRRLNLQRIARFCIGFLLATAGKGCQQ